MTEQDARRHSLYGVDGWLLCFLLVMFLQFLWHFAQLEHVTSIFGVPIVDDIAKANEFGFLRRDQSVVSALSLMILSSLASMRVPQFRTVSIAVLIAQWPLIALLAQLWPTPPAQGSLLPSFAFACVLGAWWIPYLQLSRRVRVTFENLVPSSDTSVPHDKNPTPLATYRRVGWSQVVAHGTILLGAVAISFMYLLIGHEERALERTDQTALDMVEQQHIELVPRISRVPVLEAQPFAAEDSSSRSPHPGPVYPPLRPAEIYSSFRSGVDSLRVFAADDTVALDMMTLTAGQREGVDALLAAATSDGNYTTAEAYGIDINGDQTLELLLTKNSGGTADVQDADVYQIRSEEPTIRHMFQFPSGHGHASFLRFDGHPGLHVASALHGLRYQFGPGVKPVFSTSVARVDGLGLLPAPEIMSNPIAVFCAGRVARVSILDSAQCLSAWDSAQKELLAKFDSARKNRTKIAGTSKDWDNLMVAATNLLEPLVNSGHHEHADAYLQKIWPSDDRTSLREFRIGYWNHVDKEVLVGSEGK